MQNCRGVSSATAVTDASGIARIGMIDEDAAGVSCQPPKDDEGFSRGFSPYYGGLYITAAKDNDFSFVHTSWSEGIEG